MVQIKNNHFELLWMLAKTDFQLRYHGSVLGYLWTLLKPLLNFAVTYIVFSLFMKWDIPYYQLYLLMGIILWNFFVEGTMLGVSSLAAKINLIRKVAFPKILIVIASTLSAFISLFFNLIILAVFVVLSDLQLSWHILLLPVFLVILYFLVLGISLALAAIYIKFRDINQIWDVVLQVMFWLVPIIYSLDAVPENYKLLLYLNPVTGLIQYSRLILLSTTLPLAGGLLYVCGVTGIVFLVGLFAFAKLSPLAAEEL